jgi:hypothetical protein
LCVGKASEAYPTGTQCGSKLIVPALWMANRYAWWDVIEPPRMKVSTQAEGEAALKDFPGRQLYMLVPPKVRSNPKRPESLA